MADGAAKREDACCGCLSARLNRWIGGCFVRYGTFASKRPCASILVAFAFLLACCPGFLLLRVEVDGGMFYIEGSLSKEAFERRRETFPFNPSSNSVSVYFVAKEGKDLSQPDVLVDIGKAMDGVLALKTPAGKPFEEICERSWRGQCESSSVFHTFREEAPLMGFPVTAPNAGEGELESLARQLGTFCSQEPDACRQLLDPLDGFLVVSDSGIGSLGQWKLQSLAFVVHLDPAVEDAAGQKGSDAFQVVVMDYIHAPGYEAMKDNLQTEDFYALNFSNACAQAEGARPANAETHLMAAAFLLIVVFVCLSICAPTVPRSRALLAMSVMMIVGLSLVCALGLSAYCDVPLTSMTALVVFTLFGVSVDDIIVMVHAYDRLGGKPTLDGLGERITTSLQDSGTAITLTSATSLVAFLCAALCPILNIRWFCVSAAFGILSVYVLQITLFLPLFVLDERRRLAGRRDCWLTCCLGGVTENPGELPADPVRAVKVLTTPAVGGGCGLVELFSRRVAYSWWFRAGITLTFFVLTGLGVWGSASASSEADLTDYYMDTSFVKEYFKMHQRLWESKSPLELIIEHKQEGLFTDEHADAIQQVFDELAALDCTYEPVEHWLHDFGVWLNATYPTAADLATARTALQGDAAAFGAKVAEFLDADPFVEPSGRTILPWQQKKNVVMEGGVVKTSRLVMHLESDFTKQAVYVADFERVRDVVYGSGREPSSLTDGRVPNVYVFAGIFPPAERDSRIKVIIFENLAIACAAVASTIMLMLNPLIGLFIGVLVFSLDAMVLALLTLYGSKLDFVAFLCLSMSIGLIVDYATHTCHAYMHHQGSLDDKLYHSMRSMGSSVLSGGSSTFLGISVLAFAGSKAFRTFFYVLGTAVVMGTAVGVIISPALLRSVHGLGTSLRALVRHPTSDTSKVHQVVVET